MCNNAQLAALPKLKSSGLCSTSIVGASSPVERAAPSKWLFSKGPCAGPGKKYAILSSKAPGVSLKRRSLLKNKTCRAYLA